MLRLPSLIDGSQLSGSWKYLRMDFRALSWLVCAMLAVLLHLGCPEAAWGQNAEDRPDGNLRLRKVYVPFADLAEWMKGRGVFLPMSEDRYRKAMAFLNRTEQRPVAQPDFHFLQLQRNGTVSGESYFSIPADESHNRPTEVDLEHWRLPGRFYRLDSQPFPMFRQTEGAAESSRWVELQSGVDQDGLFGVQSETAIRQLAVRYSVEISTSELFEGRRRLELPCVAGTDTVIQIPAGLYLNPGSAMLQRLQYVPESENEFGSQYFRLATTEESLSIGFETQPPRPDSAVASREFQYRVSSRVTLDPQRQRFETVIPLEYLPIGLASVNVQVPGELSPTVFSVNGKPIRPDLIRTQDGKIQWRVPVPAGASDLELKLAGDLPFHAGSYLDFPRFQVDNGLWQEGTATLSVRDPYQIQDFQLIDCRFEQSQMSEGQSGMSVRFLGPDSQLRLLVHGNLEPRPLGSYSRLSFQGSELQSQQWLDIDLSNANSTSLRFQLPREWIIGQIGVAVPGKEGEPDEIQSLVWYREQGQPDLLTVSVPDSFLGSVVRIQFQGQVNTRQGTTVWYEGLRLVGAAPLSQRLVSVTSTAPVVATVQATDEIQPVEAESARQTFGRFSDLIQPEPTFLIRRGIEIPVLLGTQQTSTVTVNGVLKNTLLDNGMLAQEFQCDLQLFGASLQQLRIFTNQWGDQLGVWTLTDPEGEPVEFSSQVTATEQGSLTTFKLKQAVSTSLRMIQKRNVRLTDSGILPAYHFPDVGSYSIEVRDRSMASQVLWYDWQSKAVQSVGTAVTAEDTATDGNQYQVSLFYNQDSSFPVYQLKQRSGTLGRGTLESERYWHQANSLRVRTRCQLVYHPEMTGDFQFQLPDGGKLDAVQVDGLAVPVTATEDGLQFPVSAGDKRVIEIRFSTVNKVELFQWSERDYRLKLLPNALEVSQLLQLSQDVRLARTTPADSLTKELTGRWLFLDSSRQRWQFPNNEGLWLPLAKNQFALVHSRNHQAWCWLISVSSFLLGLVLYGSYRQWRNREFAITSFLLLLGGFGVAVLPFALAQLVAAGVWGMLAGHCTAYLKQQLADPETAAADRSVMTQRFFPSLMLVFLIGSTQVSGHAVTFQDTVRPPSLVVIPLDEQQQPGSVVYLDRPTFDRISAIEKAMDSQSRIQILSGNYRLMFDQRSEWFQRLEVELKYHSPAGGVYQFRLPNPSISAVEQVTVGGNPAVYRIQDQSLRITLPPASTGTMQATFQLQGGDRLAKLALQCLPTADSNLELQGAPPSWMVEVLDLERHQVLDRSYSRRSFAVDRVGTVGIRLAADPDQLSKPVQETWLDVSLNKVGCRSRFHLGPYQEQIRTLRLEADHRLVLPAHYYYSTSEFQIKAVGTGASTNLYELTLDPAGKREWIELEWETDLSPIGQLVPPQIRLLDPELKLDSYLAISVDRRLLFQTRENNLYERVGNSRLPSGNTAWNTYPARMSPDQVYLLGQSSESDRTLGEVRLQPVQVGGNIDVTYVVGEKQVRSTISGSLEIGLGELPQLRFQVASDFRPDQVYVGVDSQNVVAWYHVVETSDGPELICFLNRPLSGTVELNIDGTQGLTGQLQPAVFREQMPELHYQVHLFHPLDTNLAVQTRLQRLAVDEGGNDRLNRSDSFSIIPESGRSSVIEYQLDAGDLSLKTETVCFFHLGEGGEEILEVAYQISDTKRPIQRLMLDIPTELGPPTLIAAVDAEGRALEAAQSLLTNGNRWQVQWDSPQSDVLIRLMFSMDSGKGSLRLPSMVPATEGNTRLVHTPELEELFRLPTTPAVSLTDRLARRLQLDADTRTYEIASVPVSRVILERKNRVPLRVPSVVAFQQWNYRKVPASSSSEPVYESIYQAVLEVSEFSGNAAFQVPESASLRQVWVNGHLTTPVLQNDNQLEIALLPDQPVQLISIRLLHQGKGQLEPPFAEGSDQAPLAPADKEDSKALLDRQQYRELIRPSQALLGDNASWLQDFSRVDSSINQNRSSGSADLLALFGSQFPDPESWSYRASIPLADEISTAENWETACYLVLCCLGFSLVVAGGVQLRGLSLEALSGFLLVASAVYGVILIADRGRWAAGICLLSFAALAIRHVVKQLTDRWQRWQWGKSKVVAAD